jgi:hypothetical protein
MALMHGVCSQEVAAKIDREPSAVRAIVNGRQAVVTAGAWHPTTQTAHEKEPTTHYVRAEFFPEGHVNMALEGAIQASPELQELLDQIKWLSGDLQS